MINNLILLLQIILGHLAVLPMPTLAAVFLSIDCGSSDSFTDANNITWVRDHPYITSGVNQIVQSADNSSVARQYTTRRVFPIRKKNCYSIGEVGKGERVLLRAYFYYGIYRDETSSAPTFDLQFDGNHWATVDNSSADPFYYEAIYLTRFASISVCVAKNEGYPDDVPFISAIEVRSLHLGMYRGVDSTYPLYIYDRSNYGENETVRYPKDKYDRIWYPLPSAKDFVTVKNNISISVKNLPDEPPETVLRTALYNQNSSDSYLCITFSNLTANMYTIFYFSELLKLNSSKQRSFSIYMNGENISPQIIPPHKKGLEYNFTTNKSASGDEYNARYCLNRTANSTLPPIINALEMYEIGSVLTDGTDIKHVKALSLLQKFFVQLQDWSGDPCLPNGFPWDWVQCTDSDTPQIIALNLSNYGLQGSLPDFSALDTLQIIDLHNNSLSGEIPSFLGNFPNLTTLNLANNNFSGSIPSSITDNTELKFDATGNMYLLCTSNQSCSNSRNATLSTPPPPGTLILPPPTNSYSHSKISKKFSIINGIVFLLVVLVYY
ncbi:PREDICTED: putative leucine-rich repeat receptor-like protein kinase At2g19210 [Nelumbo nucifera]|uniref:Leucine-rich repeat receptor-like protein kinase At2g19210 n=2 Tax=Nelumbo nucifera TaxID=4432 RepID=A0A1U8B282_NELNU|nr:PREDICTED: putative leucine-rich repeat receptor-like protein kinase At2g19210 [Nelumbo nucifera]DAD42574.1 TPA_asm: hypothetical protein HUJ06_000804 [Nelumbo nucifera]